MKLIEKPIIGSPQKRENIIKKINKPSIFFDYLISPLIVIALFFLFIVVKLWAEIYKITPYYRTFHSYLPYYNGDFHLQSTNMYMLIGLILIALVLSIIGTKRIFNKSLNTNGFTLSFYVKLFFRLILQSLVLGLFLGIFIGILGFLNEKSGGQYLFFSPISGVAMVLILMFYLSPISGAVAYLSSWGAFYIVKSMTQKIVIILLLIATIFLSCFGIVKAVLAYKVSCGFDSYTECKTKLFLSKSPEQITDDEICNDAISRFVFTDVDNESPQQREIRRTIFEKMLQENCYYALFNANRINDLTDCKDNSICQGMFAAKKAKDITLCIQSQDQKLCEEYYYRND